MFFISRLTDYLGWAKLYFFALLFSVLLTVAGHAQTPANIDDALRNYRWQWRTQKGPGARDGIFQANGSFRNPEGAGRAVWRWEIAGPKTFHIITPHGVGVYAFDDNFSQFHENGGANTGTRIGPIAGPAVAANSANTSQPATSSPPAPSAPVIAPAGSVTTSARLEELGQKAPSMTDLLTGNLEQRTPESLHGYLAGLREDLLDEGVKKPVAIPAAYTLGARLCALLLAASDEKATFAARYRNNAPSMGAGSPIATKVHPSWADLERERDEAARDAHNNTLKTPFAKQIELEWANHGALLRRNIDATFTQFRTAARTPASTVASGK